MQKKRRASIELLEPRRLLSLTVTPYDPSTSLSTLTGALIVPNTGVNLTSSTFVGGNGQAGTYSGFSLSDGTTSVVMSNGIILTSGLATNALGPNNNTQISNEWGNPGDSDLSGLIGGTATFDANVLTLQFTTTPGTKSVGFDVVFGSDEFPEYVGQYDDVFGAFLDGTQLTYDSTKNPLTIDNNFLTLNNSGTTVADTTPVNFDIQYDGLTTALHTQAPLDPSITTHTLKLAVADAGDDQVDSGVFLANLAGNTSDPGSPSTGSPATSGAFQFDQAAESTPNTSGTIQLTIDRTGGSSGAATVDYATSDGTATAGNDYTSTSGTLDFADGQTSATITVPVLADAGGAASSNFNVTLSNPTGGAALGSQIGSVVTLTNSQSLVQLDAATYSFANDAGNATLTVDRTGNTSAAATVDYATSDGTATAGIDYGATSGTLDFSAGQSSQSITVPLIANGAGAPSSSFAVTLTNPGGNAMLGSQTASTVTVQNNHSQVQFGATSYSGANDAGAITLTVDRTGNTSIAGQVAYATSDGTAVAGTDYNAASGTLDFSAGQSSLTFTVVPIDNAAGVATSSLSVALSNNAGNAIIGAQNLATVTIANNQSQVEFAASTYAFANDSGDANVVVTREGNLSQAASVDYTTADGAAIAGTDYTGTSGTVNFGAGDASESITIPLIANAGGAATSNFFVGLSNPGESTVVGTQSSTIVTEQNNKSLVQFSAASSTVSNDSGSETITVNRTGNLSLAASVDYTTADGSAVADADYTATSGTLNFSAGDASESIVIPLIANASGAATSAFIVGLSNPGAATVIGTQSSTVVTEENNHSLVQFAVGSETVANNSGLLNLTVTRSGNISLDGEVDYATMDDTAIAGADYTATSGTLNFRYGQSSMTITIPLIANSSGAPSSVFGITLSNPDESAVLSGLGIDGNVVTLTNANSTIQLDATSYRFSNTQANATLTVDRTGNLSLPATIDYATADDTAVAGVDYSATFGTINFSAGDSSEIITVPLIANASAAEATDFTLSLANATGNGVLGSQTTATVNLQNTNSLVQFAAPTYSAANDSGTLAITVTRAGNLSQGALIDYATADGTAVAGIDYTAISGTLTFSSGESSQVIDVPLLANTAGAGTSTFTVALSNPGANTILGIKSATTVTLANDHSLVQFASTSYSFSNTARNATLTVQRTGNLALPATIDYATADGAAISGIDYTTTNGTLSFSAGQSSKTISIPLIANSTGAASAAFTVSLSNPGDGAVAGAQTTAAVTVLNNRSKVQIDSPAYSFSNDTANAVIVLTRTGNVTVPASVQYATSDGTAQANTDYSAASGTATFSAGQSTVTLDVPLILDALRPAQTSFTLAIGSPAQGAVLGSTTSTTITITNAHALIQFSSTSYTATTDDNSVSVTLTRSGNLTTADTVDYATANGSAIAGTDYASSAGTVDFAAGQSTATIQIPLHGNVTAPASSGFTVTLSKPTAAAVLGTASTATITINNTHSIAEFNSAGATILETGGIVTLPVTRVGNINIPDTVFFTTLDGTAVAPVNYITAYGTIHFDPGQSVAAVSVKILQDLKVDPTLTFQVSLSNSAGNVGFGQQTIETVSITDVTPPPTILMTNVVTPSSSGPAKGTIAALSVTFDQALASAPTATDFTLVRRYSDGPNGSGKAAPITIKATTYNPTSKTLMILPQKPLKNNQFYELTATGSAAANLNGVNLDGAGTGAAGTPYVSYFGNGRNLTYIDKDGNRVRLVLHGRGTMQLTRSADGQGQTLTVVGATAATTLTGTVQRTGLGGNGTTTLENLTGLNLGHIDLKGSQFLVSAVQK